MPSDEGGEKTLIALVAGYDSLDGQNGELPVAARDISGEEVEVESQPRQRDISFSVGSKHVLTPYSI
jgi:predicted ABC-type transport system involved in lysophospholipase L1 biosynthesis ATPase subunit